MTDRIRLKNDAEKIGSRYPNGHIPWELQDQIVSL